jgi:hypothetical protein
MYDIVKLISKLNVKRSGLSMTPEFGNAFGFQLDFYPISLMLNFCPRNSNASPSLFPSMAL